MRILIVGSGKAWRFEATVERAFRRAGHTTLLLDDRQATRRLGRRLTQRWLLARAQRFDPDFVLLSKCLGTELTTVERLIRGRGNAMWYSDPQWYPHLERPDISHIAGVARRANVLFVPAFAQEWAAIGANARFLPFAGDRDIRPARVTTARSGVAFLGAAYDPARVEFIAAVARNAPLTVWGPGWERYADFIPWSGRTVEGAEFARVCSGAAITLGVTSAAAEGHPYYTDRMFLVILAGGFYLGEGGYNPPGMLRGGEHCAWFESRDECVERIRYYLAHPDERERIREQGERFVRAYHTYDQRIHNFLSGEAWVSPLDASSATSPSDP